MKTFFMRQASLAAFLLASTTVQAHTGHNTSGLYEGLIHPFGLDHLLAMLAVGVWSVSALPADKAWRGPGTFIMTMMLSALMGAAGITLPYLENLIALSVLIFGAMIVVARTQLPTNLGLSLIALAATMHGLAHASETSGTDFSTYAVGFLISTAALHLGGMLSALSIRRNFANQASLIIKTLGVSCGGAGLYLLSHIT